MDLDAPVPAPEPTDTRGPASRTAPEAASGTDSQENPEAPGDARRQALRDVVPWSSPMTRMDKILILGIFGGLLLMLASLPLRPFLIASSPVALSALTGGLPTIGAGAAFARIGETSLVLVIIAGVFGMIKLDWLFWLAGRTWGPKALTFFTPGRYAERFVQRLEKMPRWVLVLMVVLSFLPGIPKLLVHLFAGLAHMRLATFLIADALGALAITGTVVWLGFTAGQDAVDIVIAVDKYALWVTIAILAVGGYLAGAAASKHRTDTAN